MGLLDFIGGIFKPAADLVDSLHTSAEEKLELSNALEKARMQFGEKALEYEGRITALQAQIVTAEAKGNALQRSWRPILMLVFGAIVVLAGLGLMDFSDGRVPDKLWQLLTVGIGGYIAGRTGEKIVATWRGGANGMGPR